MGITLTKVDIEILHACKKAVSMGHIMRAVAKNRADLYPIVGFLHAERLLNKGNYEGTTLYVTSEEGINALQQVKEIKKERDMTPAEKLEEWKRQKGFEY